MNRSAGGVVTVLAIGLASIGASVTLGSDDAHPSHSVFAAAPAASRNRQNPYAGDADAIRAGRKLYLANCASCHGEISLGTKRGPSLISDFVKRASPGELEWFLRNGSIRRGMPSWSGLPEQRRWQITEYVRSLQTD